MALVPLARGADVEQLEVAGRPVAVYCATGYRASLAASILQAGGFTAAANVPGGYQAWTAAGRPTVTPPDAGKKASDTER